MTKTSQDKPAGLRRGLQAVLVISLALNLLVAGAIAGAILRPGKWNANQPPRLDMVGSPMTRALSKEDRRVIGHKMRQAYRDKDSLRNAHREQMKALISELKTVPFDPDAVHEHMKAIRNTFGNRLEIGQVLLVEHLADMSDAERAAYADQLQDGFRRHDRK